jgi:hypothetical protein
MRIPVTGWFRVNENGAEMRAASQQNLLKEYLLIFAAVHFRMARNGRAPR